MADSMSPSSSIGKLVESSITCARKAIAESDSGTHRYLTMAGSKDDPDVLIIGFVMANEKDIEWLKKNRERVHDLVKDVGVLQQLVDASKQTNLLAPDKDAV